MYCSHFGLHRPPFNNTPDPTFYFSTPEHEEALATLQYATTQRKGFVLITGEIGAGKTLIARMFLRQMDRHASVAVINHTSLNGRQLLAAICTEFELPVPPDASNLALTERLQNYLIDQFAKNRYVVVLVDEAQNLSDESFEELRMLGNLEADDAKLLQICILGQPELRERFRQPGLRQLDQRLFRRFHLGTLSREATEAYIAHRLRVAGCPRSDLFTPEAIEMIYQASQGIPRLINQICDNALLTAYGENVHQVDAAILSRVIERDPGLSPAAEPLPSGQAAAVAAPRVEGAADTPAAGNGSTNGSSTAPVPVNTTQNLQQADTLHALEARLVSHDQQIARTRALLRDLAEQNTQHQEQCQSFQERVQRQWRSLQERLDAYREEIQNAVGEVSDRYQNMQRQFEKFGRNAATAADIEELRREYLQQTQGMVRELSDLRGRFQTLLEQVQQQGDEVQRQLAAVQAGQLNETAHAEIEREIQAGLNRLSTLVDQHRDQLTQLTAGLREHCESTALQLEQLRAAGEQAGQTAARLHQETEQIREDHRRLREETEQLHEESRRLHQQTRQLYDSGQQLREQTEQKLAESRQELEARFRRYEERISELDREVATRLRATHELIARQGERACSLEDLGRVEAAHQATIQELLEQFEVHRRELDQLRGQIRARSPEADEETRVALSRLGRSVISEARRLRKLRQLVMQHMAVTDSRWAGLRQQFAGRLDLARAEQQFQEQLAALRQDQQTLAENLGRELTGQAEEWQHRHEALTEHLHRELESRSELWQQKQDVLAAEHRAGLAALRERQNALQERQEAAARDIQAIREVDLQQLRQEQEARLRKLREGQNALARTLIASHKSDIERLQRETQSLVASLAEAQRSEVQRLEDGQRKLADSLLATHREDIEQLRQSQQELARELRTTTAGEIRQVLETQQQLFSRLREEQQTVLEQLTTEQRAELERLNQARQTATETILAAQRTDLAALRQSQAAAVREIREHCLADIRELREDHEARIHQLGETVEARNRELLGRVQADRRLLRKLVSGVIKKFRATQRQLNELAGAMIPREALQELEGRTREEAHQLLVLLESYGKAMEQQFAQVAARLLQLGEGLESLQRSRSEDIDRVRSLYEQEQAGLMAALDARRHEWESILGQIQERCTRLEERLNRLPGDLVDRATLEGLRTEHADHIRQVLAELEARRSSFEGALQQVIAHCNQTQEAVRKLAASAASVEALENLREQQSSHLEDLSRRIEAEAARHRDEVKILVNELKHHDDRVARLEELDRPQPVRLELTPAAGTELSRIIAEARNQGTQLSETLTRAEAVVAQVQDASGQVQQALADWKTNAELISRQSDQLRSSAQVASRILKSMQACHAALDRKLNSPRWQQELARGEQLAARLEQAARQADIASDRLTAALRSFEAMESTAEQWTQQQEQAKAVAAQLATLLAEARQTGAAFDRTLEKRKQMLQAVARSTSRLMDLIDSAKHADEAAHPTPSDRADGTRPRKTTRVTPVEWPAFRTRSGSAVQTG